MKKVYILSGISDYGKFISFCIKNDITVFRTYWDEREIIKRCYYIDWIQKRCYYSDRSYWESKGYEVVSPIFLCDKYGNWVIQNGESNT